MALGAEMLMPFWSCLVHPGIIVIHNFPVSTSTSGAISLFMARNHQTENGPNSYSGSS